VRLYAEAFAEDPKLTGHARDQRRYNAACAAALGGSGFGKDDPPPDAAARAKLRQQALVWLRADLAACTEHLAGKDAQAPALVRQRLRHWQEDPDLRGVRGDKALTELPAGERQAWAELWADVAALLQKAEANQ
jgi:serine/threonine-protein kinase